MTCHRKSGHRDIWHEGKLFASLIRWGPTAMPTTPEKVVERPGRPVLAQTSGVSSARLGASQG